MKNCIKEKVRRTLVVDVDGLDAVQTERLKTLVAEALEQVTGSHIVAEALGWTPSSLREALQRLEHGNGKVQSLVIREALQNDGYISRDRVYHLGGYDPERVLRGFTRPVNRTVTEMKSDGLIPQEAASLLTPSYREGVRADGFLVPAELRDLLSQSS